MFQYNIRTTHSPSLIIICPASPLSSAWTKPPVLLPRLQERFPEVLLPPLARQLRVDCLARSQGNGLKGCRRMQIALVLRGLNERERSAGCGGEGGGGWGV